MQMHSKCLSDLLAQIAQTPTHDAVGLGGRSSANPTRDLGLLRRRQLAPRTTTMRPVEQATDTLGISDEPSLAASDARCRTAAPLAPDCAPPEAALLPASAAMHRHPWCEPLPDAD